ncbi:MAG: PQQ-binding-like beta-propeller repeat protein [Rhodopirellula sp.]|nr:PQQ-binding-like beta-propeller repeat protein [Rhodopirellula sp.]
MVVAPFGERHLAVLGSVARRLVIVGRDKGEVSRTILLPAEGSGMAVRGDTAYVTTAEPDGRVLAIDLKIGRIDRQWPLGHTPMAPILSGDGRTLFAALRFENRVVAVDLKTGARRWATVVREPVALVLGPGDTHLFVANHLPCVRPFLDDENPHIAAEVSVIDTGNMRVVRTIELPNGSQGLRGLAVSPDGKYVAVTHILSHYTVPTITVAAGAMNRNALSLLRADSLEWFATAILDDPQRGAANPWGVDFAAEGNRLVVAHAGVHELSVIEFDALVDRLAARRDGEESPFGDEALAMMTGIRTRISLPTIGPRAICLCGQVAYTAGFFSDDIAAVDLHDPNHPIVTIDFAPSKTTSAARLGERYFNDAMLCLEHWQSCATCHPDGRTDALYWDLLNDGIGNTKNTKSLLMAALTPPVMWRGVRADAGMAVLSGIRHIQFMEPSEGQAEAIEEYLRAMTATPSPRLNAAVRESPKTDDASCAKCHFPGVPRGTLSEAAQRGKTLFEGKAGCAACHPHPYFTSMQTVDAGLGSGVAYDVPSLVEAWRSAPYLHSGDALTFEEAVNDFNHLQMRGTTKRLSETQLRDLVEYLQSL